MQWQQLKQIKQEFSDVVFGYIRIYIQPLFVENKDNPYYNIPELVYNFCLLFWYHAIDEFDTDLLSEIICISNENKTITINPDYMKTKQGGGFITPSKYCTSYGNHIIPSTQNATYIWKFKNLSPTRFPILFIGICAAAQAKSFINDKLYTNKTFPSYLIFSTGTRHSWNKQKPDNYVRSNTRYRDTNTVVTMRLTFNETGGKLYYQNDKKENKRQCAFDVEQRDDLQYRMAICMGNLCHVIQLLEFKKL